MRDTMMHNRHRGATNKISRAWEGMHALERGLLVYHGLKGDYQTGAAIASAAAPLMAAAAL